MKLWKIFLLALGLACQSFACQPPTPLQPPVVVDTPPQPLWSQARDGGSGVYGWFPQFMYGKNLITYTKKRGIAHIIALDKDSGQEVWAWSDLFEINEEAKTKEVHIYGNILIWRSRGRTYVIDIETGKTLWKQRVSHPIGFSGDEISGVGNRFVFPSGTAEYYSGDLQKREITLNPKLRSGIRIYNGQTHTFVNSSPNLLPQVTLNDTLVVLPYMDIPDSANVFTIFNITKNQEIYTKSFRGDTNGVFVLPPIVFNNKIFFPAGGFILCCNLQTGNEIWRSANFGGAFSSGITIANGKIHGTNESGFSCCFDPETGKTLWQTRTRGGASKPFYMNGVIYFTSIADGHLYGLDAENGKILMKIDDPRGGIGFGDMVAGADGKIYANTYTHLYCFKAAR